MDSRQIADDQARSADGDSALPLFARKATGLVREVSLAQMIAYNAASTNPLGLGLVIFVFALVLFPRANPYVALIVAGALCLFVWTAFALMTAAIPRVGGDYTINTRILPPWLALGGNVAAFISGITAAPLIAYELATAAISPALTVIGAVTHSHTITRWGNDFSSGHHVVTLIVALLGLLLISVLAALGTRIIVRVLTAMILIATAGLLVDFFIVLFTSHAHFVSTLDSYAGKGAYATTVAAGAKQGLYPDHGGYSTSATIGAIYYASTVTVFTFWGTYLSSEFKGAGQRRRQLWSMAGTGVAQTVGLIVLLFVFTRTVGYDFFVSSINGNFSGVGSGAIGSAGYLYFGAILAGGKVLVALLALAFLGWFLPAVFINISMPHRALLTWAFDGLLPRWFSDVNPRTHTPVRAIAVCFVLTIPIVVWIALSTSAIADIAISTLFSYLAITLVGVSAAIVKWRRPNIYRGSPAEWRLAGLEALPIAGVGCTLVGVLLVVLALHFHVALGLKHFGATIAAAVAVFVIGLVWWMAARAIRRKQGLDLSLAYQELPPE